LPKPRNAKLESPTARRRLAVRKKPYWTTVSPGLHLGYRRNAGSGTWSVRVADSGAEWVKRIAVADDLEPASPPHVLSYWQALDAARALARRQPGEAIDESRPLTVSEALTLYERDLLARGSSPYNAEHSRIHLPAVILNKPVALLGGHELRKWRDSLLAKGLTPGTVNRTKTGLRAALELAAAHDPRIANQRAWKVGLAALPDAHRARNVILDDATVRRIVAAAYDYDRALGVMTEVAATTGARLSQLARLEVADLQADGPEPRLLMPLSAKGRARNKRHERRPVPIRLALAAVLKQEAQGRAQDAPLLLRANGERWGHGRRRHHRDDFRAVVQAAGLNPDEVTLYALRHSSIVRQLLANVPIRIVATLHDTSVKMIERSYSRYIASHSDEIARRALIDLSQPAARNVVALPGRSS
jgi:protein-disulfide isomerase-like protein with CxxC motif